MSLVVQVEVTTTASLLSPRTSTIPFVPLNSRLVCVKSQLSIVGKPSWDSFVNPEFWTGVSTMVPHMTRASSASTTTPSTGSPLAKVARTSTSNSSPCPILRGYSPSTTSAYTRSLTAKAREHNVGAVRSFLPLALSPLYVLTPTDFTAELPQVPSGSQRVLLSSRLRLERNIPWPPTAMQ